MKKIVLDVDGVLLNFMPTCDEAAKIILKRDITIYQDEYKLDHSFLMKRFACTAAQTDEILEYMQTTKMYEKLQALDGAKEALEKIKEAGFHITVVTALPEKAKEMRLKNLKDVLDFVPDDIICVGMGQSKAEALRKVNPDVFVDDRIDYLVSAPFIHHLVWCDQKESQSERESQVDVHVHSLKEWTDNYMDKVVKNLDNHYSKKIPLQNELKLESVNRKYGI